jgi:hypothetical protein
MSPLRWRFVISPSFVEPELLHAMPNLRTRVLVVVPPRERESWWRNGSLMSFEMSDYSLGEIPGVGICERWHKEE